jgi:hypothetical protein
MSLFKFMFYMYFIHHIHYCLLKYKAPNSSLFFYFPCLWRAHKRDNDISSSYGVLKKVEKVSRVII